MAEKHIHKFKRHQFKSGNTVFFCALPDCSVKIKPALTLGKYCICWRCGEKFVMTDYTIRLAKPHCENCHKPKEIKDVVFEGVNTGAWTGPPNGEAYKEIGELVRVLEAEKNKDLIIQSDSVNDLRSRLTKTVKEAEEEGDI